MTREGQLVSGSNAVPLLVRVGNRWYPSCLALKCAQHSTVRDCMCVLCGCGFGGMTGTVAFDSVRVFSYVGGQS